MPQRRLCATSRSGRCHRGVGSNRHQRRIGSSTKNESAMRLHTESTSGRLGWIRFGVRSTQRSRPGRLAIDGRRRGVISTRGQSALQRPHPNRIRPPMGLRKPPEALIATGTTNGSPSLTFAIPETRMIRARCQLAMTPPEYVHHRQPHCVADSFGARREDGSAILGANGTTDTAGTCTAPEARVAQSRH